MGFTAFSKHILTHNAIKDKRNSVLGIHCANDIHDLMTVPYLLLLSLFLLSSFFIIINFMMCRFNEYAGFTWFSCHAGFVRLLLDGCYGRWFVYVKPRNATASCWALCAGGTCTLLRTSFVDRNTVRQSIRSGKYPRCSDLSLRGKNMHSMKARFVLLICKLSLGVVTL